MTLKKDLINTLKILIAAIILSFGISVAYAQWVAPTEAPPGGNVAAPVNVGGTLQIKTGALGVAAFTADGAWFEGDVTSTGKVTANDVSAGSAVFSGGVTANSLSAVSAAFSGGVTANSVSAGSGTFSGNITASSVVLSAVTRNSWSGMVIGGGVDEDTNGPSCKSWGAANCVNFANRTGVVCPSGSTKRVLSGVFSDGPGFAESQPSLCVLD